MYEPLIEASTGEEIAPGLSYGSELGWATFGGAQPFALGTQMFEYLVFDDPNCDYRSLNFGSDMTRMRRAEAGAINAMDPDMSAFFAKGGKLIHYYGWDGSADPAAEQRRVLRTRRPPNGRRLEREPQLSALHGSRHGALRVRGRHVDDRHAVGARALGGARRSA